MNKQNKAARHLSRMIYHKLDTPEKTMAAMSFVYRIFCLI